DQHPAAEARELDARAGRGEGRGRHDARALRALDGRQPGRLQQHALLHRRQVRPGQGPALLLLVVAGPMAAALAGARGPCRVVLNLGPGDGPYVRGFAPAYEIDDKVATHWTTRQARIELPLVVSGGPFELGGRFGRPLPETTDVSLAFAGRPLDRFAARRAFQER